MQVKELETQMRRETKKQVGLRLTPELMARVGWLQDRYSKERGARISVNQLFISLLNADYVARSGPETLKPAPKPKRK